MNRIANKVALRIMMIKYWSKLVSDSAQEWLKDLYSDRMLETKYSNINIDDIYANFDDDGQIEDVDFNVTARTFTAVINKQSLKNQIEEIREDLITELEKHDLLNDDDTKAVEDFIKDEGLNIFVDIAKREFAGQNLELDDVNIYIDNSNEEYETVDDVPGVVKKVSYEDGEIHMEGLFDERYVDKMCGDFADEIAIERIKNNFDDSDREPSWE